MVQIGNDSVVVTFLLQDRKRPEVCDRFFHDVPFEANFASDITELQTMTAMPGVDGFTMKVDALYKVSGDQDLSTEPLMNGLCMSYKCVM